MIQMDMLVIAGLLPRGGRVLPIPGTADTIDAEPTDHGLEFVVDGRVVMIPWTRVQFTTREPTPVDIAAIARMHGNGVAERIAQPPPRPKEKRR
jgi:hypothetical protein